MVKKSRRNNRGILDRKYGHIISILPISVKTRQIRAASARWWSAAVAFPAVSGIVVLS
jgi:hypothetical protein